MNAIQLILLGSAVALLTLYVARFRSALRDRLIAIAFFLAASCAVVFPDLTHWVAAAVGVGRGTDLVFYLFMAGSVFVVLLLYSRVLRMEDVLTEVVRAMAIRDARRMMPCQGASNTNLTGDDPQTMGFPRPGPSASSSDSASCEANS